MDFSFSTALRNAQNDAITSAIGNGGKLKVYTSGGSTLLGTWTWGGSTAMFAASSSGVMAMNDPSAAQISGAANGTAAVAKITTSADADVVTNLSVGTEATITAASWASNVATITAAHSFAVGDRVRISGVTPSGYNGTWTIASVSGGTSFTVTMPSDPGTYTSGGTARVGFVIVNTTAVTSGGALILDTANCNWTAGAA